MRNLSNYNGFVQETAFKYGAIGFVLGLLATWIF